MANESTPAPIARANAVLIGFLHCGRPRDAIRRAPGRTPIIALCQRGRRAGGTAGLYAGVPSGLPRRRRATRRPKCDRGLYLIGVGSKELAEQTEGSAARSLTTGAIIRRSV